MNVTRDRGVTGPLFQTRRCWVRRTGEVGVLGIVGLKALKVNEGLVRSGKGKDRETCETRETVLV